MIDKTPSVVWGSETESLLFYFINGCERKVEKLTDTIHANESLANDMHIIQSVRDEAAWLIHQSTEYKNKWQALFGHWEDHRNQGMSNEVDLRGVINAPSTDDKLNTLTFDASTIGPLTYTTSSSSSSTLDYTSKGTVEITNTEYNWEVLFGSGFIVGPIGNTHFESTFSTSFINSTTKEKSCSKTVSATFVEKDSGDTLCATIYQSPHSGTYIFEVCGGATMCLHVPGTDARQKFTPLTPELPSGTLQKDSGRIVLAISTLHMKDNGIDSLDVVLELDESTALFPVCFDIGSALLNQPLEFKIDTRTTTKVYINFQRLDPNLKSIQIVGNIHSKCDSKIAVPFNVNMQWSSQCPPVNWGGDLA